MFLKPFTKLLKKMVVEGENYKDAEENYREGWGDVIKERKHLIEWDCIKMPENLEEEK